MKGRFLPREELSQAQQDEMLALIQDHFEGVTRVQFLRDLADKTLVILIEDDENRIRGFSTLRFYRTTWQGTNVWVLYSGDTIVSQGFWGSPLLPQTWIRAVKHLQKQCRGERLYWLLITSGFRTYRFLPVFWREFWPRYDAPTPAEISALSASLARERFGNSYESRTGIVRFPLPQVLRPEIQAIPEGRLLDPHIAFFVRMNPGYVRGDELVCLCELCDGNLTAAGRRMANAPTLTCA